MIGNMRVVDLTQRIDEHTVMWPGAPSPKAETILTISHDGFYNRLLTFTEHTGTHVDAPCHMVEGAQSVDQVDASQPRATRGRHRRRARTWPATRTHPDAGAGTALRGPARTHPG